LVRRAEALTRYAVVTRYPGFAEPVTEAHYQDAIVLAKAVLEWVEDQLGGDAQSPKNVNA
jgi:HEPN domain-containing protein